MLRKTSALLIVGTLALVTGCSTSGTPTPSATPTPEPFVRAEWEIYADSEWEYVASHHPGAARPEVEFERFVSANEWAEVMARCMNDFGFDEYRAAGGGLESGEFPMSQKEAQDIALYACSAMFPQLPSETQLDDEALRDLYSYYVATLAPCLEGHGYPVADAPSIAVFLDSGTLVPRWSPYDSWAPGGEYGWDQINHDCPQLPPSPQ